MMRLDDCPTPKLKVILANTIRIAGPDSDGARLVREILESRGEEVPPRMLEGFAGVPRNGEVFS